MARRVLAALALAAGGLCLLGAAAVAGLSPLLRSPTATADAVVAVASSASVRDAVAQKIVAEVDRSLPAATAARVSADSATVTRAVEAAMDDPAVQRLARDDLAATLRAAESRGGATVDLRPLLRRFATVMHSVVPGVPADPALARDATVRVAGLSVTPRGSLWGVTQLALTLVGALVVLLVAALALRERGARLTAVAVGFGAPAAIVLVLGLALPSVVDRAVGASDPASSSIVRAAMARLGSSLTAAGLLYGALAVVVTGLWWAGGHWRRGAERRASA